MRNAFHNGVVPSEYHGLPTIAKCKARWYILRRSHRNRLGQRASYLLCCRKEIYLVAMHVVQWLR